MLKIEAECTKEARAGGSSCTLHECPQLHEVNEKTESNWLSWRPSTLIVEHVVGEGSTVGSSRVPL